VVGGEAERSARRVGRAEVARREQVSGQRGDPVAARPKRTLPQSRRDRLVVVGYGLVAVGCGWLWLVHWFFSFMDMLKTQQKKRKKNEMS
jgi:ribosome biogenesis protein Tsr3